MTGRTTTQLSPSTAVSTTPPDVQLKPGVLSSPADAESVPVQITMTLGQAGVLAKVLAGYDADVAAERSWPCEGYDPDLWHGLVVDLLTVAARAHLDERDSRSAVQL